MHTIEQVLNKLEAGCLLITQMTFKQLLQLDAIDVCQIDSCRTGGVQEILAILLMAAKKGVIVCPHSGGVVSHHTFDAPTVFSLPGSLRIHHPPVAHRLCRRVWRHDQKRVGVCGPSS